MSRGEKFCLFWGTKHPKYGVFSNWHMSDFVEDGQRYCCVEQWMMAEKARLFGDDAALARILSSRNPKEMKAFGRGVRDFDGDTWDARCQDIVFRGCTAKFRASAALCAVLVGTGREHIAEASPVDAIWGIGMAADHRDARNPARWRGTNYLGIALMRAREVLRAEEAAGCCGGGGGDGGGGGGAAAAAAAAALSAATSIADQPEQSEETKEKKKKKKKRPKVGIVQR